MKLVILILASCLVFAASVDGLICYQCTGNEEQCESADDNGVVTDCDGSLSCYAALQSKSFASRRIHKTIKP